MPKGAIAENFKAELKDGVLEVTVPVPEQQSPRRQIPIPSALSELKPAPSEAGSQKQQDAKRSGFA